MILENDHKEMKILSYSCYASFIEVK